MMQNLASKFGGNVDKLQRRLVAILCADIEGYSQHMDMDEEQTITRLGNCREIIDIIIARNNGRIANTAGDSVVAEFGSVIAAVDSAVGVQKKLNEKNRSLQKKEQLRFRIGINLGDVYSKGKDILGDGVNIAARLEGLAEAGGIYISGSVYDSVKNKLPFRYEPLGEKYLKNISEPVRVYNVIYAEETTTEKQFAEKVDHQNKPSIAVLPFDNLSNDPEQGYFSDGMTEDLITDLSKLSGLLVISRHSTFIYKNQSFNIKQVGSELHADYVLEGSIRKAENKVRINAQLIEVKTGMHVWAERYDEDIQDIFSVQDEVIRKIVAALHLNLSNDERVSTKSKGAANYEVHDCYLRGLEQFYNCTAESAARARAWLAHAIEMDPTCAKAYALKARIHIYEYISGFNEDGSVLNTALALAERAIEVDPLLPQGHVLLAWAYFWLGRQEEAVIIGRHAIHLDVNNADTRYFLGIILSVTGNEDEACQLLEAVKQLNPLYEKNLMFLTGMGIAYCNMKKYDLALDSLKKANHINPNFIPALMWYFIVCVDTGCDREAEQTVKLLLRANPGYTLEKARRFFRFDTTDESAGFTRYLKILKTCGLPESR